MPEPLTDRWKAVCRFARAHPALVLRRTTQLAVTGAILLAAWRFAAFAEALRAGLPEGPGPRPPVIEGFLPIAAIVALRGLLATGQFDPVHPAGLTLLLAALATAWLFRRGLCAWICPLGALSEALGWAGRRLLGRNLAVPRWLDLGLLAAKYAVFLAAFKIFFLMPADQALAFLRTPYYAVSDLKMFDLFAEIGPVGAAVLAGLAVLSVLIRSFWCRYLCPYGSGSWAPRPCARPCWPWPFWPPSSARWRGPRRAAAGSPPSPPRSSTGWTRSNPGGAPAGRTGTRRVGGRRGLQDTASWSRRPSR